MQVIQSTKLANVCYEIRGPVLEEAMRLEAAGHRILKLNTGNPAAVRLRVPAGDPGGHAPHLRDAHGYGDAKGLLSARRAVMQHYQTKGIQLDVEDIYLGNGVSELIQMSMQALLDDGDEVLVPAPDYPLWTAVGLAGRRHRGALPLRRAGGLDAGPRRHRAQGHRPHQGDRRSSTRTTRPARSTTTRCCAASPTSPAGTG